MAHKACSSVRTAGCTCVCQPEGLDKCAAWKASARCCCFSSWLLSELSFLAVSQPGDPSSLSAYRFGAQRRRLARGSSLPLSDMLCCSGGCRCSLQLDMQARAESKVIHDRNHARIGHSLNGRQPWSYQSQKYRVSPVIRSLIRRITGNAFNLVEHTCVHLHLDTAPCACVAFPTRFWQLGQVA